MLGYFFVQSYRKKAKHVVQTVDTWVKKKKKELTQDLPLWLLKRRTTSFLEIKSVETVRTERALIHSPNESPTDRFEFKTKEEKDDDEEFPSLPTVPNEDDPKIERSLENPPSNDFILETIKSKEILETKDT